MTANDSAVLGDIAAAGATAAHNIANFLLEGCGLTRAGADLQGLGNLGSGDVPFNVVERTSDLVSTKPFKLFDSVFNGCGRRLPKENANQIKKEESWHLADPRTNKRAKVAKWAVSKASATRGSGKELKRVCKSDDVLDNGRCDVDERTRRHPDEADDE